MAFLEAKMLVQIAWKAKITILLAKEVTIPNEYSDFANVFSKKSASKLPICSDINKHAIDLKSN